MGSKRTNVSAQLGETEEAVLIYLYEHPTPHMDTPTLARELKGYSYATDESKVRKAVDEVQTAVETLIMEKLVKGKRERSPDAVYHSHLELTSNGEAEAIKTKRRFKARTR